MVGREIRFTLSKGQKARLLSRGVSHSALANIPKTLDVRAAAQSFMLAEYDRRQPMRVSSDQQLKWVEKSLTKPLDSPYLFTMFSRFDALPLRLVAVCIMWNAIGATDRLSAKGQNVDAPWWHTLTGANYDTLRDDRNIRTSLGRPSMVILDGLTVDCNYQMATKVRDLLDIFSGVPRLVLVSGCQGNPDDFLQKVLYRDANRMLLLGIIKRLIEI